MIGGGEVTKPLPNTDENTFFVDQKGCFLFFFDNRNYGSPSKNRENT